jgi:hypothetical protein
MRTLDVTAANGVPFRVVSYEANENLSNAEPLVKFFDQRYPHTEHGQFTGGGYYLRTLLEDDARLRASGLNLHGGEPAWSIDAATYRTVSDWLKAGSP